MKKLALVLAIILTTNSLSSSIAYANEENKINNFTNVATGSAISNGKEFELATSTAITLARSKNTNNDIFSFEILNNEISSTVTGYVYDENNKPLKNATVQLYIYGLDYYTVNGMTGYLRGVTNDSGYFEIKNLNVNQNYSINVWHKDYNNLFTYEDVFKVDGTVQINAKLQKNETESKQKIYGYFSAVGEYYEGAVISSDSGNVAITDENGYYEMYVDDGEHTLYSVYTRENGSNWVYTNGDVIVMDGEDVKQDFNISSTNYYIWLYTIIDEWGNPIPNLDVRLRFTHNGIARYEYVDTISDNDGKVQSFQYKTRYSGVMASISNGQYLEYNVSTSQVKSGLIREFERYIFTSKPQYNAKFNVIDSRGNTIHNAVVTSNDPFETATSGNGTLQLHERLYDFTVEADGYKSVVKTINLNEDKEIEILLETNSSVSTNVVNALDIPQENVVLTLNDKYTVVTDSDGYAIFDMVILDENIYKLRMQKNSYETITMNLILKMMAILI